MPRWLVQYWAQIGTASLLVLGYLGSEVVMVMVVL